MTRRASRLDRVLARRRQQRDRIELDDEATERMRRALDALNQLPQPQTKGDNP